MSEIIQSSRVVHWLREVGSQRGERRSEDAAFTHILRVIEASGLFTLLAQCLAQLSIVWRGSVVSRFLGVALHRVGMLELWQRVRLLGWTLFVAVLTHRLLVGIGDALTHPVVLVVSSGLLVLATGMMWGCRAIARAWVHRNRGARS